MTAKELARRLPPSLVQYGIAQKAGWNRNTWYTAVKRNQALTEEQIQAMRRALMEHILEVKDVAASI